MADEGTGQRIDIAGDAGGPVIAGNHNVVIGADHGSTVTLLVEGERPTPVRRSDVALLPRRQTPPLGRDAELARLAEAVGAGGPVQVWGAPGVGKSALLRHAARTLAPGRDGVLFLDAARGEPMDLAQDMFEACYEAQGYAPSSPELRRLMIGLRFTVYVDNAEFSAEGLRTLMDAAPDATFVVAGRERALLGDGTSLRLDGISQAVALELLARELGRPVVTQAEQDTAAALWDTATGRPLLLLRAAALSGPNPQGHAVLPRPGQVADLLPLLFDRLEGEPLGALHLLTTLGDAELDPAHIAALAGIADPTAVCARLTGLGLAEATEGGYRALPDVVPALRERNLAPVPVELLCEHFAGWIGRRSTTAAQVARHARALERVAELAEEAGRPELAVAIVRAASPALARSLRFGVWGRLLERGLPAAQHAGDRQAVAYFTHEQGIRNLLTGRRVLSAVLLTEAAVLWRQLGNVHGAHAAAGAQQYVPPPSGAAPAPVPHTDGGAAQSLQPTGPDPSAAHGATTHGATAQGGAAHGGAAHGATAHGGAAQGGAAHGSGASAMDPGGAHHAAAQHSATAHQAGAQHVTAAHHPAGVHQAAAQHTTGASHVAAPHATGASHMAAPHVAGAHTSTAAHGIAAKAGVVKGGGIAAHSAGVTHAGAASAAGATGSGAAAVGTSAVGASAAASSAAGMAALMKVVAVVIVVAVGGVAVHQAQSSDDSSSSGSSSSSGTGLAGTWQTSDGGKYIFVDAGHGSYTNAGPNSCGIMSTLRFSGSNGSYSAPDAVYDNSAGSCRPIADATTTITLGPGGNTAQAVTEMTSGNPDIQCYTCGTVRQLTREP
ncbi:ATP-binding protein [Streptomyces sp. NPDC048416]|uniref:ATP-binding protein n=1 Tax=Streptomyces sp. NPDC048416 TaxID=3365546 RepID=UPI00371BC4BF